MSEAMENRLWGFIDPEDGFVTVPKTPLIQAGFEKPPFEVRLPNGTIREIVEGPVEARIVTRHGSEDETPVAGPKFKPKTKLKVYTASKLHHASFVRDVIARWPEIEVTSRWPFAHVDGDQPLWPGDCMAHGSIFWTHDEEDVRKADVVLLFGEEGDIMRGGLVEVGMGIAYGKHIIVVGENASYGTWRFHPLVYRVKDIDTARSFLSLLAYSRESS